MKQDQKLFVNQKEYKFNNVLNKIIYAVIVERKLTFQQISKLIYKVFSIKYPNEHKRYIGRRNHIIQYILGKRKLTYNKFKFIMEEVLNEPIPDDPEITHMKNIGNDNCKDLRNQVFDRLTVIECVGTNERNNLLWKCQCECGNIAIIVSCSLLSRMTKSCGCYGREQSRIENTTHGKSKSSEYRIWSGIIQRCTNPNNNRYSDYGGRGITVCDRWLKFENFYADMGDRPDGMSIDRKDNDGNYEPDNCRWATDEEQRYNKRNTPKFDDDTPVGLWAHRNNLNYDRVNDLFHKGFIKDRIKKAAKRFGIEISED